MTFSEQLNLYINEIGCSAKELADESGISASAISRYRAGARVPTADGKNLQALSAALARLSERQSADRNSHVRQKTEQQILEELAFSINGIDVSYSTFIANLNALVSALSISNSALADALGFDPSYVSRILARQRKPADVHSFVENVSQYIARRQSSRSNLRALAQVIDADIEDIDEQTLRAQAVANWLGSKAAPSKDPTIAFLEKIDRFDSADFSDIVDEDPGFDETGSAPTLRHYTGIDGLAQSELDFIALVAASDATDDIVTYSDASFVREISDPELQNARLAGIARLLKKGLHLKVIHATKKPVTDIISELEEWIPLYLTGMVSSYSLQQSDDETFSHLVKTSGDAALFCEAISGHHAKSRCTITRQPEEVRYHRERTDLLLQESKPLLRVYKMDQGEQFMDYLSSSIDTPGDLRIIMSTLPIETISADLLERILASNGFASDAIASAVQHVMRRRRLFERKLSVGTIVAETPNFQFSEYDEFPAVLLPPKLNSEMSIPYTSEQYFEHLEQTRAFAREHPTFKLAVDKGSRFRNIQVSVKKGCYAVVSKSTPPAAHFLIEQPDMVEALGRLSTPVLD